MSLVQSYIFNQCLKWVVCPQAWKDAKVIPLPKNGKANFTGTNSRPISILPVLGKLMEKIIFDQIQFYFSGNELSSDFQHAYRERYSTCTALSQMTDDCLQEMDNKRLVGAVLLDFSAAFDVIDHSLLLQKLNCYGFSSSAVSWIKSYLSNRSQSFFQW